MENVAIFIFRRDFRVHDNTTLIEVIKKANENNWKILPLFVFNPRQIEPLQNEYYNSNCVQFMIESLRDLESQLRNEQGKLYYFQGTDNEVFDKLSAEFNVKLIASNKDITPFALRRDEIVQSWCDKKGIEFLSLEDYTMYPIEQVRTNLGKPFEIYTPFYRRAIRIPVPNPHSIPEIHKGFLQVNIDGEEIDIDRYYMLNEFLEQKGGREKALEILENVRRGAFRKYKKDHDFPIKDATTKLGAYLKFGCVSVRETFKVMKESAGKESPLVAQLYNRDFYYNIAYHFPEILKGQIGEKNTPMHGRYEKAEWNQEEEQLEKWKNGMTGIPIVDAAMRCLKKTGWLHNRLRMIAAMFLVNDLNIDWRVGEKYFAQHLVDYDPASNSQGWCWVLSFRRKFNPYKQTGKYDAQCEFIRKWVPELNDATVLELICWWEKHAEHADLDYPKPMVEIQGYRVKFKTYIPDYVRPKDPNYKKTPKKSKYGLNKNTEKYNKNKERNKLLKQLASGGNQQQTDNFPREVQTTENPLLPPPPPPRRYNHNEQPPRGMLPHYQQTDNFPGEVRTTQNPSFPPPPPRRYNTRMPPHYRHTDVGNPTFPSRRSFGGQDTYERIHSVPIPQEPHRKQHNHTRTHVPPPPPRPQATETPSQDVSVSSDVEKPKKKTTKFPTFILPDPKYFRPQNSTT